MQSSRSPKDTSVKLFTSEMVGAPSLTQAAGTLIGVLSACLVNGFGMQQVSSFVVTQGLGQITVPVATGWERMCVIDVAGCTDASYNGEYKLTQVSADGLRVSFPIDAPDGTVQGAAITVKLASPGWLMPFNHPDTFKAVFKPGDPRMPGAHCLQVTDGAGTHANVRGYESMSAMDAGAGIFPTEAQAGTSAWPKAFATTRPARWMLIVDDMAAWVGSAPGYSSAVSNVAYAMRGFGAVLSMVPSDMHAVALSVQAGNATSGGVAAYGCVSVASISLTNTATWFSRTADGATLSPPAFFSTMNTASTNPVSGADPTCGAASGIDVSRLVFTEKFYRHAANAYPRAKMPGVLHALHTAVEAVITPGDIETIEGRAYKFFHGPSATNGSFGAAGLCAIDVEGPWR